MFNGEIFDPFAKVQNLLKVKERICTENWIFLLHRHWSVVFMTIALMLIWCNPAMIDMKPIVCIGPSTDDVPKDFLDEWCWLSGTYIIPELLNGVPGKDVVAPGVGPDPTPLGQPSKLHRVYHNQYMFYPIVFLIQFSSFFVCKHIWKLLEGERLKQILSELTTAIVSEDVMKKRIQVVTDYLTANSNTFHNSYASKYIFCEVLNAANVVVQFWILDSILHNEFLGYGWEALAYLEGSSKMVSPFTRMFPKVAICHLTKAGPSGNAIPLEAICVLPLNNLADKIFLFWWWWLVILGVSTILGLVYRGVTFFVFARYWVFRFKIRGCDRGDLYYFAQNSSYGDWFVVSLMHKNMNYWIFANLFRELVVKMKETRNKQL